MEPARPLCPWGFSGRTAGACCHFLLWSIFLLTQGWNPCLLSLLHWQVDSLHQLPNLLAPRSWTIQTPNSEKLSSVVPIPQCIVFCCSSPSGLRHSPIKIWQSQDAKLKDHGLGGWILWRSKFHSLSNQAVVKPSRMVGESRSYSRGDVLSHGHCSSQEKPETSAWWCDMQQRVLIRGYAYDS